MGVQRHHLAVRLQQRRVRANDELVHVVFVFVYFLLSDPDHPASCH